MVDAMPAATPPGPPAVVVPADVHDAAKIVQEDRLRNVVSEVVSKANADQTEAQRPSPWVLFGQTGLPAIFVQMGVVAVLVWYVMVRAPQQEAQYHEDLKNVADQFHADLKDIRDTDDKRLETLYQILGEIKKRNTEKPDK